MPTVDRDPEGHRRGGARTEVAIGHSSSASRAGGVPAGRSLNPGCNIVHKSAMPGTSERVWVVYTGSPMRPWPLWIRLLLPFFILSVLIATVSLALIFWTAQGSVYLDQVRTLASTVNLIQQANIHDGHTLPPKVIDQLQSTARLASTRITIISGTGAVLFDSDVDWTTLENHNDRPEVIEARPQRIGSSSRQSRSLQQHAVYVAQIVNDAEPHGLVARVCYTRTRWASLQTPLWSVAACGLGATVLMVGLLAIILQRQWVRPTRDLTAAAEKMAMGQWNARRGSIRCR